MGRRFAVSETRPKPEPARLLADAAHLRNESKGTRAGRLQLAATRQESAPWHIWDRDGCCRRYFFRAGGGRVLFHTGGRDLLTSDGSGWPVSRRVYDWQVDDAKPVWCRSYSMGPHQSDCSRFVLRATLSHRLPHGLVDPKSSRNGSIRLVRVSHFGAKTRSAGMC